MTTAPRSASRRLIAIVNQTAGRGRGQAALADAAGVLRVDGVKLDVQHPESAAQTREIAGTISLDGADGIVVAGGDGTLSAVVSGLLERVGEHGPLPPIALLPCGGGNALARELRLDAPTAVARAIMAGTTRGIDVLQVSLPEGNRHALTVVGWGLAADVGLRAERLRRFGSMRYQLALLLESLNNEAREVRLRIKLDKRAEELLEGRYTMVLAANTRTTGAGMLAAPEASLDDGRLDLLEVLPTTRRQALGLMRQLKVGVHLDSPLVRCRKAVALGISVPDASTENGVWHLNIDGDLVAVPAGQEVEVRVLPAALRLFVPKGG